jgi:hypothetical protein
LTLHVSVAEHFIQSFMALLAPVSYSLITLVQEPLAICRGGVCVNTFKLIYVSSGQRTLVSVEGVSHVREREMRVGGPAAVIS